MTAPDLIERCAAAAREEIVRQHRDDEGRKCPAGMPFYEEHVAPSKIARAVLAEFLAAIREPEMVRKLTADCPPHIGVGHVLAVFDALAREVG